MTAVTIPVHHEPTGVDYQFRYNGSLTVNVWAGIDPDFTEVDVFTLSEPTRDIAVLIAHAREYLADAAPDEDDGWGAYTATVERWYDTPEAG